MKPRLDITEVGLSEAAAFALDFVGPAARLKANKVGARASQQALKKYHRTQGRKLWIIPGPTHGPGRRETGWWKQVPAAWATSGVTADGASMINGAQFFAHKVTGGLIKAKRVRFLTIPLIPEAHGKTARQYAQENRTKLFTIPGVGILFAAGQKRGNTSVVGRTVGRTKGGRKIGVEARTKLTAVFALKRSVMQEPTKGALPAPEVYIRPFEEAALDVILPKKV